MLVRVCHYRLVMFVVEHAEEISIAGQRKLLYLNFNVSGRLGDTVGEWIALYGYSIILRP